MKAVVLGSVALAVLGGCSCENKTPMPAPAAPPPVETAEAAPPAPPAANRPPVDGEATIKAAATATAGSTVDVVWSGPGNSSDYVDIVPRGQTGTTTQITYAYVAPQPGSVAVRAPTAPGEYDLRYVLDLSGKRSIKATLPLTVTAAAATLGAPAKAETGEALSVAWTGPNGPGDYIDIVKSGQTSTGSQIAYVFTGAGTPAKLEAPSAAGKYDIRYVLEGPGGRKVPATSALTVTLAKATVTAPDSVAKGAKFKVQWTGPNSSGDYIDLVRKGSTATSGELSYFYTANAGELSAPAQAGDYEIRYVLEAPGGRAVLARRAISVR